MSRPKKTPNLREQLEAVVLRAMSEKKFTVAEAVLDILANLDGPANPKQEGSDGVQNL